MTPVLFNLDFLAPVCYDVATDTRRKGGHFEKVDAIEQNKNFVQSSGGQTRYFMEYGVYRQARTLNTGAECAISRGCVPYSRRGTPHIHI